MARPLSSASTCPRLVERRIACCNPMNTDPWLVDYTAPADCTGNSIVVVAAAPHPGSHSMIQLVAPVAVDAAAPSRTRTLDCRIAGDTLVSVWIQFRIANHMRWIPRPCQRGWEMIHAGLW